MSTPPSTASEPADPPLGADARDAPGRALAGGLRLFASPSEEPRSRRPTDAVLLVVDGVILAVVVALGRGASELEGASVRLVETLPGVFDGVWEVMYDLAPLWAVGLLALSVVAHRRMPLARDLLLAGVGAVTSASIAHRVVEGMWPSPIDELTSSGGDPTFPALRLAIASSVIINASPHLAGPLRKVGRWLIAGAAVATLALGQASPGGTIGALVLGSASAAGVHLIFGSPGGRPSLGQVQRALVQLGVDASHLRIADLQPEGVWTMAACDQAGGPLIVKVYGRDAWDGQLALSVWRHLWYRNTEAPLSFTRVQQVEHDALLTLLARQAGVPAPEVRAAGTSRDDDAVLVLATDATRLDQVAHPSDALLTELWSALSRAHDAGISPGRLDPTRVGRDPTGGAVFLDWVAGVTAPSPAQELQDAAQLTVSTALVVGDERALAAAEASLAPARFGELVSYLQPASLSPTLRKLVREEGHDVEELRDEAARRIGGQVPELVRLRRVTLGSVVQAVLLLLASVALVNGLASLDIASVSDELLSMSGAALVLAFLMAQAARASGAMSTLGASPEPLPVGPLVQLQFAISYINMAVPSSAGRLAMVTRFYQRIGSTAATAIGVGALDSLANFVVQIVLIVATVVLGLGTLELDLSGTVDEVSPDLLRLVLVVGGVLVVAAVGALLLPGVRSRLLPPLRQLRDGLQVMRSPSKVALLFGGNLVSQAGYALALGACVHATGHSVGLADLMVINALVGTFAAVVPVPNGIGVSEAGLTAGLVAAGVPETTALAAAIAYRVLGTYLPPVWGFFTMRSLQRQQYL